MSTLPGQTPRLPIGQSDFPRLREPGVLYVDKTDFVTQVLTASAAVMLVPRPRRFGKTVNLSTVRYFVEKSKVDRSALFEGLSVWSSAEARTHFQRYPVIWLTFKVYQVFVVSLLLGQKPRYVVRSNRESGGGRYDVMVIPRTAGQPGVVLELKVHRKAKRETAASAMAAALRQLRERDYASELRAAGAEPIHELGVVFDGKRAWVKAAPAAKAPGRRKAPAKK